MSLARASAAAAVTWITVARAAPVAAPSDVPPRSASPSDEGARSSLRDAPPLGGDYRLMGGVAVGRGLRFENPYRLQTELGNDAESLSLTATYLDVSVAALLAGGEKVFHGATVHASFALDGIAQEVITPSYMLLVRPAPRWAVVGRAGIPIVVEPDANAGFELAGGGIFYVTAGMGISASLVGSLFFSAATLDSARPAIPILSAEIGAVYDYEVLP